MEMTSSAPRKASKSRKASEYSRAGTPASPDLRGCPFAFRPPAPDVVLWTGKG